MINLVYYMPVILFLTDSIKSSVGNKVKILFKNVVRLETKGDKTENRVLVSTNILCI